VFPARYELNSYIVFRKRLVSKRLTVRHFGFKLSFFFSSLLMTVFSACLSSPRETGQGGRYRDWLWAGRQRGQSLSPSRVKNSHFSMLSRLALRSTQPI
jgi:hypothetical protein